MEPAERKPRPVLTNLQAGTTTAVVIIPQGMAYAMLAGLDPIHGLYASLLPLLAYALVGQSRQMAVGPGALDTLLVGTTLGSLAFVTASNYSVYAAILALEVAAIQLVLGALRAGFLVNFLSRPVISGFTSAAALTIGFSQMRNLLGFEAESAARFDQLLAGTAEHIGQSNPATAVVGLLSVAMLVGLKRWKKGFPRALAVVVVAISAVVLLDLESRGVAIIGAVPSGLPPLDVGPLDPEALVALLPTAFVIAFVGYLTMISIAKTFADRNGYDIDANREMVGAGAANLLAGLTQGFPVSASFSRSAVHADSGATSPYALIVTAGWVALTLLVLTPLFTSLPKATLAAIIITAVFGLIDVAIVKRLYRVKKADMWLLLITFVATLVVGIVPGIGIGVGCSLVLFVFRTTQPHTAVLGRLPGTRDFRNVKNYAEATPCPGLIVVRIDAQFYFGNVNFLKDLLRRLEREADDKVHSIIIEACSLNQLDSSADAALHDIVEDLRSRQIQLCFATVKMPVMRVMKASGLWERVGEEHFFMNVHDAVEARQRVMESA